MNIQGAPFVPGSAQGPLRWGRALDPGDIVVLRQRDIHALHPRPAGLVVVEGAPLSHPMIRLLALGIPAVLVDAGAAPLLREGEEVFIDGTRGMIQSPGVEAMPLPKPPPPGRPVLTRDGAAVALRASVPDARGVARAVAQGASAIGLVRSEYLSPEDGRMPDADFFEGAFRALLREARGLPVTIRLLDIAPDKRPPWLGEIPGMEGPLGRQGARLYDVEPVRSVFHAQLEALSRLAPLPSVSLLIPYVVRLREFRRWREVVEKGVGTAVSVGTMAETPVAVLEMGNGFRWADLVAIGCNDLMQCLFAADRDIPELKEVLDPYAPPLFRFLRQAAEEAGEHLAQVQVCGLLPQVQGVLPVLLGLGYRAFSVDPVLIPILADIVSGTSLEEAGELASKVCRCLE
ncbi:MAG: phosphoenolpyruvate-protein phosphotransferase, partial [Gammaproteobacteria bacterium]